MDNKPPVLSKEILEKLCNVYDIPVPIMVRITNIAEAQRDADVEWYEKRKKKPNIAEQWVITEVAKIKKQARQETAREIFREIRLLLIPTHSAIGSPVPNFYIRETKLDSLKSKFLGGSQ